MSKALGVPNNWVDLSRGQVNASSTLNGGRTDDVGHSNGAVGVNSGTAGARHNVEVTDDLE